MVESTDRCIPCRPSSCERLPREGNQKEYRIQVVDKPPSYLQVWTASTIVLWTVDSSTIIYHTLGRPRFDYGWDSSAGQFALT
jgi:hypothetical protein